MKLAKRLVRLIMSRSLSEGSKQHEDGGNTLDFMNDPVDVLIAKLEIECAAVATIVASCQVEAVVIALIEEVKAQNVFTWRRNRFVESLTMHDAGTVKCRRIRCLLCEAWCGV